MLVCPCRISRMKRMLGRFPRAFRARAWALAAARAWMVATFVAIFSAPLAAERATLVETNWTFRARFPTTMNDCRIIGSCPCEDETTRDDRRELPTLLPPLGKGHEAGACRRID